MAAEAVVTVQLVVFRQQLELNASRCRLILL